MHSRSRAVRPAVANQPESVSPDQPDQNDAGVFANPMVATPRDIDRLAMSEAASTPPAAFLCPINKQLMEWPVMTSKGNSYEFSAISSWFELGKNTDPMTNMPLKNTDLITNVGLRSQIQEWVTSHPEAAVQWRCTDAVQPPESPEMAHDAKGEMAHDAWAGLSIFCSGRWLMVLRHD